MAKKAKIGTVTDAERTAKESRTSMVGYLLSKEYLATIEDDRPLLVKLDQPSGNLSTGAKWVAGFVLMTTASFAGNKLANRKPKACTE